MQFQVSRIGRDDCGTGEWEARVDLAAAHRLAVMQGFHEGIFNHLTQVVPGKPDRYYQIPFGMLWSEVKASSFIRRCRRPKSCFTRICRLLVRSPVSKIPASKRSAKRKSG